MTEPFRSDHLRSQKAVDASPATKVEDRLAGFQAKDRGGVAAPQTQVRALGNRRELFWGVSQLDRHTGCRRSTTTRRLRRSTKRRSRREMPQEHYPAEAMLP